MNKYLLSIVLLSVLYAPLTLSQTPLKESRLHHILYLFDRQVSAFVDTTGVPGVAITIVKDNRIVFLRCYGVRKAGAPEKLNMHTVFRIGSVSKTFASVLAGMLVNEGVLNWDDKILQYVPHFTLKDSDYTRQLTVRHILSHTTGVVPHAFDNLIEARIPYPKILEEMATAPIGCRPGTDYGYQNVMFSLIGDIIRAATGIPYQQLLRERIFKPLHMSDASTSYDSLISTENFAHPHVRRYWRWRAVKPRDTYYSVSPAAGINASIRDMGQWLLALLGAYPEIVPPGVIRMVTTPVIRTRSERRRFNYNRRIKKAYYGLGWRIFDYAGNTMYYHSGGLHGYHAQIAILPDHKLGIAVLQHCWFGRRLPYEFFDLYLNLIPDQQLHSADN